MARLPALLNSKAGVSLVEVLFAAIILGIAVISFSYLFGTAGADVVKLGNDRVSLAVAQHEMEALLDLSYDAPELAVGRHYRRFKRPPDPMDPHPQGDLFVDWNIAVFDDPYGTGQDYKTILLVLYDDLLDEETWSQGDDPAGEVKPIERVVTLTALMAP
jgi:hypothetical protein